MRKEAGVTYELAGRFYLWPAVWFYGNIACLFSGPSADIESNLWREMYDFSDEAVLMVVASELYDEADYIRDYDEFLKYVGEGE